MGRLPCSLPATRYVGPLYSRLITYWTVKYASWPITNDKQLIKATRANWSKRLWDGERCIPVSFFFSWRWPWCPEKESSTHHTALSALNVCVCLSLCMHLQWISEVCTLINHFKTILYLLMWLISYAPNLKVKQTWVEYIKENVPISWLCCFHSPFDRIAAFSFLGYTPKIHYSESY